MRFILLLFIIIALNSCYNRDEFVYGGYNLSSESDKEKFILHEKEPDSIFINDEGVKYDVKLITYINNFEDTTTDLISKYGIVISPFVDSKESRFDHKFILILQHPLPNKKSWNDKYYFEQYSNINYKQYSDVKIWYWIINKIDDIIYGPYTKEMYLKKRVEIGVPDSLRFRFEVEKQNQRK